jgi:hypothetical protein
MISILAISRMDVSNYLRRRNPPSPRSPAYLLIFPIVAGEKEITLPAPRLDWSICKELSKPS